MNRITVLFFATLRDRTKERQVVFELPDDISVKNLKSILLEKYPNLEGSLQNVLVAVNKQYAFDDDRIPPGAEVAFFPPVSGGNLPSIFKITLDEIDLNTLLAQITLPTTGAVCIFSGFVRAITTRGDAHNTQFLEYEAYISMAEEKMRQVADEIRQRWSNIEGIAIVQRIGRLYPGTPTVVIACTAAHRDTGVFEAARYGIDRLKEIVPIWKKEVGPGGEVWVEGDYIPTEED